MFTNVRLGYAVTQEFTHFTDTVSNAVSQPDYCGPKSLALIGPETSFMELVLPDDHWNGVF